MFKVYSVAVRGGEVIGNPSGCGCMAGAHGKEQSLLGTPTQCQVADNSQD